MVGGMRGEDAQDISHQIEFDDQVETCRGGRGGGEIGTLGDSEKMHRMSVIRSNLKTR